MAAYVDQANQVVRLGEELGRGGEAVIYKLAGHPQEVAKIYHKPPNQGKIEKLKILSECGSAQLRSFSALPKRIIRDERTKAIAGFTMPFAPDRHPIFHLSAPKSRRHRFPNKDYRFIARVAVNTARAFSAVHHAGIIIGDVNESGALVGNDATVFLVDCDSFQVECNGRAYLCDVGVPIFTPPELQGKTFDQRRTIQHDCFGLAILLFNLLFMGRHPFSGRFTGGADMPIERAIAERRFVPLSQRGVQRLEHHDTLLLQEVGELGMLFDRAFTTSARPSAVEWIAALQRFEHALQPCPQNPTHWVPVATCPWCRIENSTGVLLFGFITTQSGQTTNTIDIVGLWRPIELIISPPVMPFPAIPTKKPSIHAITAARAHRQRLRHTKWCWFGPIILELTLVPYLPEILFIVIINVLVGLHRLAKIHNAAEDDLKNAIERKKLNIQALRDAWNAIEGDQTFASIKAKAQRVGDELSTLPSKRTQQLAKLEREKKNQQLEAFLDKFLIADAKIDGIGRGRLALLHAEQVVTAADITPQLRVSGFGPTFMGRLQGWREQLERRFVFDSRRSIEPSVIAKLEHAHAAEVQRLCALLKQVPSDLNRVNRERMTKRERLRVQAESLLNECGQLQADISIM